MIFRWDPCGIVCLVLTYASVFYSDYVVVIHLIKPTFINSLWGIFISIFYNILVFFLLFAHFCAVFSDPGIVPLPENMLNLHDPKEREQSRRRTDGWSVCIKCAMYRPPRAHHCRICRRCVRKMDHHCPWINNCVGEYNQKYFIQFLVYVGLCSICAIVVVVITWVADPDALKHGHKKIKLIHSVILTIISVLFGLFVWAIFCDQMQAILGDETAVEYMKRGEHRRRNLPKYVLMSEVFGSTPWYLWLCPFQHFISSHHLQTSTLNYYDEVTLDPSTNVSSSAL